MAFGINYPKVFPQIFALVFDILDFQDFLSFSFQFLQNLALKTLLLPLKQNLPSLLMFFQVPFHPHHHGNNAVQMRMRLKFCPQVYKTAIIPIWRFCFPKRLKRFPSGFKQGITTFWLGEALFCSILQEA